MRCGVAAGAAAGNFLGVGRMRSRIGAEKELRAAAGCGPHQRNPMLFAFQHRQAVKVRADAALENLVAVVEKMLRGDRGSDVVRRAGHILGRLARGDVFEHHPQLRQAPHQGFEHSLDEHRLAVEHIDRRVGDFAVHQKRNAELGHRLQRLDRPQDIGHTGSRIGGGAGRVILERLDEAGVGHPAHLVGRRVVGEIERHQRLELCALWHGGQDALAIGGGLSHGAHWRLQVGHDDGAAELTHRGRQDGCGGGAIAHVQVPVVGAGY